MDFTVFWVHITGSVKPITRRYSQILILLCGMGAALPAQAQQLTEAPLPAASPTEPDTLQHLALNLEFRPRTEFRNGYRALRSDSTKPAFFTENRTRLLLTYRRKGFRFHTSIQDVRVWGAEDPRTKEGSIQLFEGYVEPQFGQHWSIRIGRQVLMYDNQRLFAQNNWRQTGRAHDGVRFRYQAKGLETELFGAFNQESGAETRFFGTSYAPDFANYKVLLVHYLRYQPVKSFTLTTLHANDAFQDEDDVQITHWRETSGGRVEWEPNKKFYATAAAYYQYGRTPEGQPVRSWYVQPEMRVKPCSKLTLRGGAEVFSGDDALKQDGITRSFDALYGVNHRFLGSMDYFIRFPGDLRNAGLIAPYLFAFFQVHPKLLLRGDGHLFYNSEDLYAEGQLQPLDRYLGLENDWLIRYDPNDFTSIDLGVSMGWFSQSMETIQSGGNSKLLQTWGFLMITITPELLHWSGPVRRKVR